MRNNPLHNMRHLMDGFDSVVPPACLAIKETVDFYTYETHKLSGIHDEVKKIFSYGMTSTRNH